MKSLPRYRLHPSLLNPKPFAQFVQPAPGPVLANLSFSMAQRRDQAVRVPQGQYLQSREVVAEDYATTSRLDTVARAVRRMSLKRLSRGARHTDILWREIDAVQNTQSAPRSSLINQSTIASLEPKRRKSSIVRFIGDINSELEKLGHRLYCQRIEQTNRWVDGRRICIEGSPEVEAFKIALDVRGIVVPPITNMCIHLEKVQKEGENVETIVATTQGTLTTRAFQAPLMDYIEEFFRIDDEPVVKGDKYEDDHVYGSKIAEVVNLRSSGNNDRGVTVKQTQAAHRLRTNFYGKVKPTYDLEDLRKPLSEVLRPMEEADKAVWNDRKNLEKILISGVVPNFLSNQYAVGHRWEWRTISR